MNIKIDTFKRNNYFVNKRFGQRVVKVFKKDLVSLCSRYSVFVKSKK